MADGIEFSLKFQDQASAALKTVQTVGAALDSTLKQLNATLMSLDGSQRKAAGGAGELAGATTGAGESMLGAVAGGELLAHGIEMIAEKAWEGAKSLAEFGIEAVDNGFKAKVAFQAMAGGVEEGNAAFEEAERTARDLAAPVKTVTDAFLELQTKGVKQDWIRGLVVGAQDLATVNPKASLTGMTEVLADIAGKGEFTSRSLLSLQRAGLNVGLMAKNLGARDFQELQKRLESHPMGLYQGLQAVTDTIKAQAHEDILGQASMKGALSFSGTIQRIKNEFEGMFTAVDNGATGPMADLRAAFEKVAELLDPMSTSGKGVQAVIKEMASDIAGFITDVVSNKDEILTFFRGMEMTAHGVLFAFAAVIKAVEFLAGAAGSLAGGGGLEGIKDVAREIYGPKHEEATAAEMRSVADTTGPAGFPALDPVPHLARGGIVDSPTLAMIGDAGPEAVVPLSDGDFGGRGDFNAPISLTVHVDAHGGGGDAVDEQALAARIMEMLPTGLVSPLERIAATRGVT